MASIELNDDCLEHICKWLDLEDQLALKKAGVRLESVAKSFWLRKCKKVELTDNILGKLTDAEFLDFMACINDVVEELKMDTIYVERFRLLKDLNFPKVKSLECDLYNKSPDINDQDTLLVTRMFPQLTKLKLSSSISGKYIWLMTGLVDLDLSCCEYLDTNHFEQIFTTLKLRKLDLLFYGYNTLLDDKISAITRCDTLEELKIDDHHLLVILDSLLNMPKMRKIVCYTRDYDTYEMKKMADSHGLQMHTVIFHDVLWSKDDHIQQLVKMKNLRRLLLRDDDITGSQLIAIGQNCGKLREFYFIKGRQFQYESELVALTELCPQLEVMDISKTTVSDKFLDCLIQSIQKQNRPVPLELRCFGTRVAEECVDKSKLPPQLRISVEESVVEWPCSRSFHCEWDC